MDPMAKLQHPPRPRRRCRLSTDGAATVVKSATGAAVIKAIHALLTGDRKSIREVFTLFHIRPFPLFIRGV